ncbi:hypothetical protein ACFY7Z_25260 [Streptomyces sp. NPDC012623]
MDVERLALEAVVRAGSGRLTRSARSWSRTVRARVWAIRSSLRRRLAVN